MEQMASNIRQNADKRAADREDSGKVRRRRQGRRQGGRKTVEAMRTIAEKIAIVEEIPARQTFSR
jgi:methyl-accepting chemotaxis protein